MKNKIIIFIVIFLPSIVCTIFSGIIFLGRVKTGFVDWKFYASLAGFVIFLLMTLVFVSIYIKKKLLS